MNLGSASEGIEVAFHEAYQLRLGHDRVGVHARITASRPRGLTKYEYLVLEAKDPSAKQIQAHLDRLGNEGWHLVNHNDGSWWILERPKQA